MLDPEAIRREAAILARRRRARTTEFRRDSPCDWRPMTVMNPEDGQPFTSESAWMFIADLLDAGHPMECVELQQPAGKPGYVLIVPEGERQIYIKFDMGSGKINGRSFHYSEHPRSA